MGLKVGLKQGRQPEGKKDRCRMGKTKGECNPETEVEQRQFLRLTKLQLW